MSSSPTATAQSAASAQHAATASTINTLPHLHLTSQQPSATATTLISLPLPLPLLLLSHPPACNPSQSSSSHSHGSNPLPSPLQPTATVNQCLLPLPLACLPSSPPHHHHHLHHLTFTRHFNATTINTLPSAQLPLTAASTLTPLPSITATSIINLTSTTNFIISTASSLTNINTALCHAQPHPLLTANTHHQPSSQHPSHTNYPLPPAASFPASASSPHTLPLITSNTPQLHQPPLPFFTPLLYAFFTSPLPH